MTVNYDGCGKIVGNGNGVYDFFCNFVDYKC